MKNLKLRDEREEFVASDGIEKYFEINYVAMINR